VDEWPSYSRLEGQNQINPQNQNQPHTTPCPLKSCRTCRINNNQEGEWASGEPQHHTQPPPSPQREGGPCKSRACNRKNCNVGRHSKKSKSVFPKINFLDLSKIHRKKNMKMCMQTTLAAEAGGSSEDYLPLLITSTDDLVLPINAEDSAHQPKKRKLKWNKTKEAFTKFLDTLTRTFCLPLLG